MGKGYTEIMAEREATYQALAEFHIKNNPHLPQSVKGLLSRSAVTYCLSAVHKLGVVEGVEPKIKSFEEWLEYVTVHERMPPEIFLDASYEYEYKGQRILGTIQHRTNDGGWNSRGRKVFRVTFAFKECLKGQPGQDKPNAAMKKLEVAVKSWKRGIDAQEGTEEARRVEFARMRKIFGNNVERPYNGARMRIRPVNEPRYIEFYSGNGRIQIKNVNGYLSEEQFKRIADIFLE